MSENFNTMEARMYECAETVLSDPDNSKLSPAEMAEVIVCKWTWRAGAQNEEVYEHYLDVFAEVLGFVRPAKNEKDVNENDAHHYSWAMAAALGARDAQATPPAVKSFVAFVKEIDELSDESEFKHA